MRGIMTVPLANRAVCELCGCALDTRAFGIFQWVQGWIEQRRTGGANAIALPERAHRFACAICIDRLRHGIPVGQMSIYDAGAGKPKRKR
jgi:hypothetical protein